MLFNNQYARARQQLDPSRLKEKMETMLRQARVCLKNRTLTLFWTYIDIEGVKIQMPTDYYYILAYIVHGGIAAGSGTALFYCCYMITMQMEIFNVDTETQTLTQQERMTTQEEEEK